MRTTTETFNKNMEKFKQKLVKKYGEEAAISFTQLCRGWGPNSGKTKVWYACADIYRKTEEVKLGRSLYVVTASDDPAKVRDKVKAKMLPEAIRNDPSALIKELGLSQKATTKDIAAKAKTRGATVTMGKSGPRIMLPATDKQHAARVAAAKTAKTAKAKKKTVANKNKKAS